MRNQVGEAFWGWASSLTAKKAMPSISYLELSFGIKDAKNFLNSINIICLSEKKHHVYCVHCTLYIDKFLCVNKSDFKQNF